MRVWVALNMTATKSSNQKEMRAIVFGNQIHIIKGLNLYVYVAFLIVWILIPFVTQLPYTLPRYNPWQLFLKETPHFQSAPLSPCTLRSWPLLLWGLQLWNHKMTGSFSSNTCGEIAQREVLIRWSILWGIHFSLQKRKCLTEKNLQIVNVNELVLQDVRPHFLTFGYC